MALTIKELLAADTISQAADKINFNFDQLLLNGGGPAGPIGPIGPPGPVGGRGIRGSQWYEGAVDPNTIIFLDLEENDSYLQGNGDVWEYNGTAWVLTGINLEGPQGIAGASIWGETGNPVIGGQQITYPTSYTGDIVRSVLVGALPTSDPIPVGGEQFWASLPITNGINIGNTVMGIQVPNSTIAALRFMGADANNTPSVPAPGAEYTQNWAQMQRIDLFDGDMLQFTDPKLPTLPSQTLGYLFRTAERSMQTDVGGGFLLNTGMSTSMVNPVSQTSDITLRIVADPFNNPGPGEIFLQSQTAAQSAGFKVGTSDTALSGAPLTGNIWGEALAIRLSADGAGVAEGLITLSGTGPIGYDISAPMGQGFVSAQDTLAFNSFSADITALAFDNLSLMAFTGDVNITSLQAETKLIGTTLVQVASNSWAGTPGGALMWNNPGAGGTVVWRQNNPQAAPPAGFNGPFPGSGRQAVFNVNGLNVIGQGDGCMTVGADLYPGAGYIHGAARNALQVQSGIFISESLASIGAGSGVLAKLNISTIYGTDVSHRGINVDLESVATTNTKGFSTFNRIGWADGGGATPVPVGHAYFTGLHLDFVDTDNSAGAGANSGDRIMYAADYTDANSQPALNTRDVIGFAAGINPTFAKTSHKSIGFATTRVSGSVTPNTPGMGVTNLGEMYGLYLDNNIGVSSQVPDGSGNWLKTGIQVGYGMGSNSSWGNPVDSLYVKNNVICGSYAGDDATPNASSALVLMPRVASIFDGAKNAQWGFGAAGAPGIGWNYLTSVGDAFYSYSTNKCAGPGSHRTGLLLWSSDMEAIGSNGFNDEFYNFQMGPHADGKSSTLWGQNWKGQVRVTQGWALASNPGGGATGGGAGQAMAINAALSGTYALGIEHIDDGSNNFGIFVNAGNDCNDYVAFFQSNASGCAGGPGINGIYTTGDVMSTGGQWANNSDIRLKTDIEPLPSKFGLEGINKIKPSYFKWKGSEDFEDKTIGIIAQELQEVFPHLVYEQPDDAINKEKGLPSNTLGASTVGLIIPLVSAVQELSKENEELKSRLKAIEEKLGI